MRYIIFDTETTGLLKPSAMVLEQQPKIIELGAVYIKNKKIINELTQLINPNESLPVKIINITGIKDEDLIGKPTFKEYLPILFEFFKDADVLICHNAPFDVGMLKVELRRSEFNLFEWPKNIICTIQEYKSRMGKWPKMTELYLNIMGKPLEQSHRALDDCKALYEILIKDNFFDKIEGKY